MIAFTKFWLGRVVTIMLVFTILSLPSCNKEEPVHSNEYVNNWIYTNMDFWYYWNTNLPAEPDKSQEHEAFFNTLLNSNDRFSWIQDNFQDLINSLQGVSKEAGYEIALYRESPDNNNVGQGKETAPGQLKKTYGGSATDYAPGQQKKSDGSWTLKVDDGNKPKSSSKDKGGQDKSTGKKP